MKFNDFKKKFLNSPEGKKAEADLAKDPSWHMNMAIFDIHLRFALPDKEVVKMLEEVIKDYQPNPSPANKGGDY